MEKDYFKDRHIASTQLDKIKYCMEKKLPVYICLKHMQPFATELSDLSKGYITKILTKHDHPRGIKVIISQCSNGMIMTGRVVYISKNNLILTTAGWKEEKDVGN